MEAQPGDKCRLELSIDGILRPARHLRLQPCPCSLEGSNAPCAVSLGTEGACHNQVIEHGTAFKLQNAGFGKGDYRARHAPEIVKDLLLTQQTEAERVQRSDADFLTVCDPECVEIIHQTCRGITCERDGKNSMRILPALQETRHPSLHGE
jgi:hypothetical protein